MLKVNVHPGARRGVGRAHLMDLVERLARPLGLTPTALLYLRAIARMTAHADWSDPTGPGPRCYVRQADLAAAIGVGRSTANRIERRLVAIGLVAIRRLDNNHRAGRMGALGATGVFLAPLIARSAELAALQASLDEEERARKAAYGRASIARAELRAAIRDAESAGVLVRAALLAARAAYAETPRRLAKIRDIDALHRIAEALGAALEDLETAVESAEISGRETAPRTREMKHACPKEGTRPIHTTSNSETVRCSRWAAVPAEDPSPDPDCAGSKGFEEKPALKPAHVKPSLDAAESEDDAVWAVSEAKGIPIASLYRAASDEFRMYLDEASGGHARLADVSFAASMRRRELRIRDAAWDAAEALGEIDRAVAVLILDRNQRHPVTPVRNPGGALIGMVKKARRSELRLTASIIGILEREGPG